MRLTDPIHFVFGETTSDLKRGRGSALNDVETGRTETDESQEETDSGSDSEGDRTGNQPGEPLTETKESEEEEDDSFQEDGSQSFAIGDRSSSL